MHIYFSGRFDNTICHWLVSLLDVLTKGFMPKNKQKKSGIRWGKVKMYFCRAIMYWKTEIPAGAGFLKVKRVPATFFLSFFLFFLETPEAGFLLPFIKARGVVCGRNCSTLWLLHENCGVTSCLGIIQGILVQNMCPENSRLSGDYREFTRL